MSHSTTIAKLRCVLLSGPYADAQNREVMTCFHGKAHKSVGLVEVTLSDGATGIGEGYMAVFAPRVFESMLSLVSPYLIGQDSRAISARVRDVNQVCDYWSLQGAARHLLSAIEIALVDAKAKQLGLPAYELFGGAGVNSISLYASGGDFDTPDSQQAELKRAADLGIKLFKTRGRNWEPKRTAWVMENAAKLGMAVGVDMAQNLANPGQTVNDVIQFLAKVKELTAQPIRFLEEPLGPMEIENFRLLRAKVTPQICGGETITTPGELSRRLAANVYDFVQPDATVIGGIGATLEVVSAARSCGSRAVVHAWGGAACLMANYHAAFAGGSDLAEFPMPEFALRDELLAEPLSIQNGKIMAPRTPGIGVKLTAEIERRFAFNEAAVYSCRAPRPGLWSDDATWDELHQGA
jgi:L-alanine-DL-glutamate epimerase-like enolase superfamily enzyme